ncbi:hypothetical protein Csa_019066 [Cucumis sativus]|uniref:Uncharacterized protein n=1 Tax=Cucumis sativus TaxID=3659 RepID=A0A0A0KDC8_CUCSA|nr:hypothetical protein Csa_019066 [Cucumis sativus]
MRVENGAKRGQKRRRKEHCGGSTNLGAVGLWSAPQQKVTFTKVLHFDMEVRAQQCSLSKTYLKADDVLRLYI